MTKRQNPKPKRQSLDVAAKDFIFGDKVQPVEQKPAEFKASELQTTNESPAEVVVTEEPTKTPPQKKTSLLAQLQQAPVEGTKRFCVDLPLSMHQRLTDLAFRTGRAKTEIVRLLLEQALDELEQ